MVQSAVAFALPEVAGATQESLQASKGSTSSVGDVFGGSAKGLRRMVLSWPADV